MIYMLVFCVVVMLCALLINKMITTWQRDTMKSFKQEEAALRNRHERAIREQKKSLIKLRRLKNRIKTYEQMVEDAHIPEKDTVTVQGYVKK